MGVQILNYADIVAKPNCWIYKIV